MVQSAMARNGPKWKMWHWYSRHNTPEAEVYDFVSETWKVLNKGTMPQRAGWPDKITNLDEGTSNVDFMGAGMSCSVFASGQLGLDGVLKHTSCALVRGMAQASMQVFPNLRATSQEASSIMVVPRRDSQWEALPKTLISNHLQGWSIALEAIYMLLTSPPPSYFRPSFPSLPHR